MILIIDGLPIRKESKIRKTKNNRKGKLSNKRSLQNIKALTRKSRRFTDKKIETPETSNKVIIDPKITVENYQPNPVDSSNTSTISPTLFNYKPGQFITLTLR